MTGLIVKDIKIILQRKLFFILMFAFAVFFSIDNDASFGVTYFTMICTIFSSTTISYDEAGNCYAYLMAMPFTKADYVKGKYMMGIIFAGASWLLSAAACLAVSAVTGNSVMLSEYIIGSAAILPAALILVSVTIPTTLKFGQQGGIIASAAIAAIAAIIVAAVTFLKMRAGAVLLAENAGNYLDTHPYMILVIGFAAAAVVYLISFGISKKIMDGKEF